MPGTMERSAWTSKTMERSSWTQKTMERSTRTPKTMKRSTRIPEIMKTPETMRPGHRKLWSDRHRLREMYRDRPGHRELCTPALGRAIHRKVAEGTLIDVIALIENLIKINFKVVFLNQEVYV